MSNPTFTYLHEHSLKDVCTPHVVVLKSDHSVEEGVRTLVKNHILSAPVVDTKTNKVLGLIDMLDIVWTVLKVAPEPTALKAQDLQKLEMSGRAMALETLDNVVGVSGRDPYVPVFEKNPISSVVHLFASGVHRVPIFNDDFAVVGSVSQSSVIKFLSEHIHMGKMKVMSAMTAEQLGLGQNAPITAPKTTPVIKVLKLIRDNGVSAIGLTEEDGKLAGNFSATDLSGMYVEKWPSFLMPACDFLAEHSPNSMNSICCTGKSTLQDMCKEMTENSIHRLWVVDEDFKPKGLVSATDIFKVVRDFKYE